MTFDKGVYLVRSEYSDYSQAIHAVTADLNVAYRAYRAVVEELSRGEWAILERWYDDTNPSRPHKMVETYRDTTVTTAEKRRVRRYNNRANKRRDRAMANFNLDSWENFLSDIEG